MKILVVGGAGCNRNPREAVEINLHGARKVLDAARSAGGARFVFASTCSEYRVTDTGCDSSTPTSSQFSTPIGSTTGHDASSVLPARS